MTSLKERMQNSIYRNNFTEEGLDKLISYLNDNYIKVSDPADLCQAFQEYDELERIFDEMIDPDEVEIESEKIYDYIAKKAEIAVWDEENDIYIFSHF